jgi:nucleoside 2-deoxyribosyltransferase
VIYLASPYSHPDPAVRRRRFKAACRAAAALLKQGLDVYSPIVHSTPIAACGIDDMDHAFWMRVDKPYLDWCRMVMVLKLDGWRQSRGINMELAAARRLKKPVCFINPADLGVRDVLT